MSELPDGETRALHPDSGVQERPLLNAAQRIVDGAGNPNNHALRGMAPNN
jgi:hypothetical protein